METFHNKSGFIVGWKMCGRITMCNVQNETKFFSQNETPSKRERPKFLLLSIFSLQKLISTMQLFKICFRR